MRFSNSDLSWTSNRTSGMIGTNKVHIRVVHVPTGMKFDSGLIYERHVVSAKREMRAVIRAKVRLLDMQLRGNK